MTWTGTGKVAALAGLGCSVYHDGLSRSLLRFGLDELLRLGVTGLTTNPALFHQAISAGTDYDDQVDELLRGGRSPVEAMWSVIVDDVQRAADALAPVHAATSGRDGFVSAEVDPALAHDGPGTLEAAKDLWARVDRPNVMIKIPATPPGLECVEPLTVDGVNLNVTVVPTVEAFEVIFRAHARGLARRREAGLAPDVRAVASLFIARIDSVVDDALETLTRSGSADAATISALNGRAGIAIGRSAYRRYVELSDEVGARRLAEVGASLCRPLMASMAPKDPARPVGAYVDALVGPDVVMTLPMAVIRAVEEGGHVQGATVLDDVDEAIGVLDGLAGLGIGPDAISDGVQAIILPLFSDAMTALEALIGERRR